MSAQNGSTNVATSALSPCTHCKRSGCGLVRIESLCEECYILVRVVPIKNELARLDESRQILLDAEYSALLKLGEAKKQVRIDVNGIPRKYRCLACQKRFDTMLSLMQHEREDCVGEKPTGAPRAKRVPKTKEVYALSEEDFE